MKITNSQHKLYQKVILYFPYCSFFSGTCNTITSSKILLISCFAFLTEAASSPSMYKWSFLSPGAGCLPGGMKEPLWRSFSDCSRKLHGKFVMFLRVYEILQKNYELFLFHVFLREKFSHKEHGKMELYRDAFFYLCFATEPQKNFFLCFCAAKPDVQMQLRHNRNKNILIHTIRYNDFKKIQIKLCENSGKTHFVDTTVFVQSCTAVSASLCVTFHLAC